MRQMRQAIDDLKLDLGGAIVLTEAANGPYVVTPIIPALAGAETVYAFTRNTRFGTADEVSGHTQGLARAAGCLGRLRVITELGQDVAGQADIVTNSGHLRPLSRERIGWLKAGAVIPLMYEAWEFRRGDLDLDACRARGIPVAGTDEAHRAIGVRNYLGMAVVRQLLSCPVPVWGSRLLLLCDNPFAPHIAQTLRACGASVLVDGTLDPQRWRSDERFDAVVVAMRPRERKIVGGGQALVEVGRVVEACPDGPVIQFWGDIDRQALAAAGVPYLPRRAPARGHMGGLLSELGTVPVIRLQAGGCKVGEVLWRAMKATGDCGQALRAVRASGYGQPVEDVPGGESKR